MAEKAKGFEEYFIVLPQLAEGAEFFGNTKSQGYLQQITLSENDLTAYYKTASSNIP